MNKNGQTLILFVLFLPMIIILAAFVIDIGLLTNAKIKLDQTTTTILKEFYEKRMSSELDSEIEETFLKNKISVEKLKIDVSEDYLKIQNEDQIKSIFGRLIGIEEYTYQTKKTIRSENGKLKITEE